MPQRPQRPCRHKGCRNLHRNANGYCDQHRADANRARRGSAGKFSAWYTTAKWRSLRAKQLRMQPLCEFCLKDGKVTAATICDHVEPHRGDESKFWSGPFQSLCQTCHSSTKQRIERGSQPRVVTGVDGWPVG